MASPLSRDETRVVNIQYDRCDVYIGRGSPYGNPYSIGPDGDRAEVLRKFAIYLEEKLKLEPAFEAQLLALKGKILGCHCVPLPCHGDVIMKWLESR